MNFFTWLKGRGLAGVSLSAINAYAGKQVFLKPNTNAAVHFYRNVFTVTPKTKMKQVTLKAIHAQESKEAAQEKGGLHCLSSVKWLLSAAKKVEDSVGETTYMDFQQ